MTIEQQALALVNEVRVEGNLTPVDDINYGIWAGIALKRALERHEAFRKEVSEAVDKYFTFLATNGTSVELAESEARFSRFIIAPPVDPLVEALKDVDGAVMWCPQDAERLRAALAKHGLQITGVET